MDNNNNDYRIIIDTMTEHNVSESNHYNHLSAISMHEKVRVNVILIIHLVERRVLNFH